MSRCPVGVGLAALAGARLPLSSSLEAYALAGMGLGRVPGTPDFRGQLGVAYSIQPGEGTPRPPKCIRETGPERDCDEVEKPPDKCPDLFGLNEFRAARTRTRTASPTWRTSAPPFSDWRRGQRSTYLLIAGIYRQHSSTSCSAWA